VERIDIGGDGHAEGLRYPNRGLTMLEMLILVMMREMIGKYIKIMNNFVNNNLI
jgi:hypothetical protein